MKKLSSSYIKRVYKIDLDIARAYESKLRRHISEVQKVCVLLGVPMQQSLKHDESIWTVDEFVPYALRYQDYNSPATIEFQNAWLHHIHHNPHHWQHWIFPISKEEGENGVIEMADNYALEMVADWIGASVVYEGSDDMTEWLSENIPKITVHSKTAKYLESILSGLRYTDLFEKVKFHQR